jgi:uncharacterized protein
MAEFEWDEKKRRFNLEKHGLDFRDAFRVFAAAYYSRKSRNRGNDRERFLAIGELERRLITIVYTVRGKIIRIISMRKARYEEEEEYYQEKNRHRALYH